MNHEETAHGDWCLRARKMMSDLPGVRGVDGGPMLRAKAPMRAGIDPYDKLIDRVADDNMTDITYP